MGTLLIDENHAHDIFAAMYNIRWLVRNLSEKGGISSDRLPEWLTANDRLDRAVSELEAILKNGTTVNKDITTLISRRRNPGGKPGRPRLTQAETVDLIYRLRAEAQTKRVTADKIAMLKKVRRLERSLPEAMREAVRISQGEVHDGRDS